MTEQSTGKIYLVYIAIYDLWHKTLTLMKHVLNIVNDVSAIIYTVGIHFFKKRKNCFSKD